MKQSLVVVMSLILVKTVMSAYDHQEVGSENSCVLSLRSQAYLCHESSQIPVLSPAGLLPLNQGEGKQQTAKDIKTLSP